MPNRYIILVFLSIISFVLTYTPVNSQLLSNEPYVTSDDGVIRMKLNI